MKQMKERRAFVGSLVFWWYEAGEEVMEGVLEDRTVEWGLVALLNVCQMEGPL